MIENNLVNYEIKTSTSHNYNTYESSSSPDSFPKLMENGVLVKYQQMSYVSEVLVGQDSTPQNRDLIEQT